MQIYFKICEFGNTNDIRILHELWNLKSTTNLFNQYNETYLPNTWYDLNAELKKAGYTKTLTCPDANTIQSLYNGNVGSDTYNLNFLKAAAFYNKESADAFKGNAYPKGFARANICDTHINEQSGYGFWSNLIPTSLTSFMNDNGTYYILYNISNTLNPMVYPPMLKCGNLAIGWDTVGGARAYSGASDTMVMTTDTTLKDLYSNADYTNGKIETYLNNKLVATLNHPKKGDKFYSPNQRFTNNDVIELKFVKDVQPTQPTQPSQTTKPTQPTQPSQVTKPKTPETIKLPTIEHVTFTPDILTAGQNNVVTISVDKGYKYNDPSLYFENQNGFNSAEAKFNGNTFTIDLTNIKTFKGLDLEHDETIEKEATAPVYLQIPQVDGVNLTVFDGSTTHKVTQLEIGKTTNIGIELDERYSWDNDNSKGKGLIYTNQNTGNDVALGYWQGETSYLVDLTKVKNPSWLTDLRWDLKFHKYIHDDEHNKPIPIDLELTHCESDTTSIMENSTKTVTLTADDGYVFDNDVIIYPYRPDGLTYYKSIVKANKAKVISFDFTVGAFADYDKDITNEDSYPHIKAVATKVDEKPTGTQALNIYDMTDGELNTFMNSIITQIIPTTDGSSGIDHPDFQQFVNQVYRLPFDLPQSMLKDVDKVKSGKWHITVNTKQVTGDTLIISAGKIKIDPIYHNANDYNPITCKLYLPFAKEVSLDISDLINHTISIKYNIDLLTGETTVIVDNEDGNIFTNQFNITTSLEFYGLYYTKTVGHLNSTFINDILTAFIKLTYRKPVKNIVSYETNEHGKLKDYTGFTRCKNLVLNNTKENYSESNEINQLLLNGVVINDTKGN